MIDSRDIELSDVVALSARVCRRALTTAGACVGLLVSVYLLAVCTRPGQRFEDGVLQAATLTVGSAAETHATTRLDRINPFTVTVAALAVVAISLVRRKALVGFVSAAVIGASVLTVQALRWLALRPTLLPHGNRREDQSFPSGHVAVAMAVMSALVLVTPYRFRAGVLLVGSLWATGINVATITASWHRPSDTIGSDLIVVIYTCAAVAVIARRGWVSESTTRTKGGGAVRTMLALGYAAAALAALGAAALDTVGSFGPPGFAADYSLLAAGRAVALSGSAAVALSLLALLRRVDLTAPGSIETRDGDLAR